MKGNIGRNIYIYLHNCASNCNLSEGRNESLLLKWRHCRNIINLNWGGVTWELWNYVSCNFMTCAAHIISFILTKFVEDTTSAHIARMAEALNIHRIWKEESSERIKLNDPVEDERTVLVLVLEKLIVRK